MTHAVAPKPVRNLVVVGIGLIGGSLAVAAKQRGLCDKVYGVARRQEVCAQAVTLGVVDEATTRLEDIAQLLGEGDLIFIAVPTLTVGQVLADIQRCVSERVTITDGASVKGSVLADAIRVWGAPPPNLVLGHPIAGSEKSGVEAANPELYDHHRVILTPTDETAPAHLARVTALWQGVGAEVLTLAVQEHDEILAATSHLPHVIAYSLVDTLAHDSQNQNIFRYAAGGFRDFTRIASSDATMWRDIMLANKKAILHAIDLFAHNLSGLRQAINEADGKELMGVFSRAKAARDHFTKMLSQRAYIEPAVSALAYKVSGGKAIRGVISVPGDKSISHRAVMLGAIAVGVTHIEGFLEGEDALATIQAFRDMGVVIEGPTQGRVTVYGVGLHGLRQPAGPLYLGGSGTSMRLLAGLMAAQTFGVELVGDKALNAKRMANLCAPLKQMGARIEPTKQGTAPLTITGGQSLQGLRWTLPVASGQIKSAILLAGLYANGVTTVVETTPARDHTERMLAAFDIEVERHEQTVSVKGGQQLVAADIQVPGDISSALLFIVAAAITPGSDITVRKVGVNPTRVGILRLLQAMGAGIEFLHVHQAGGEPVADIRVQYRPLIAIKVMPADVEAIIDEFPLIFIAATCAQGITVFATSQPFVKKESSRFQLCVDAIKQMGVECHVDEHEVRVVGGPMQGTELNCQGDHRLALAYCVAGVVAKGGVVIQNCGSFAASFPLFETTAAQAGISLEIFNA